MKEIERLGIPAVLICTLTSIAQTVGANRIHPANAIPHPVGDPSLPFAEERQLRKNIVCESIRRLTVSPKQSS